MRRSLATLTLVLGLSLPTGALAAPAPGASPDPSTSRPFSAAPSVHHAVRGVVRALSTDSLTLVRTNRTADLLTFILDSSTVRSGTIAVGVLVSVRYRVDGDTRIATAVRARRDPRHRQS